MKAISLPENSPESKNNTRNSSIDKGSMFFCFCIAQIKVSVIIDKSSLITRKNNLYMIIPGFFGSFHYPQNDTLFPQEQCFWQLINHNELQVLT